MMNKNDVKCFKGDYCSVHQMNSIVKSKEEASKELFTIKMERINAYHTRMYGLKPFHKPITTVFKPMQSNE
jgi:hypothetical protein